MTDTAERLMRSHNKRVLAERVAELESALEYARHVAEEARADERQAMAYLSQCREAIGHEGDFPSLVERLREMATPSGRCTRPR